MAYKAYRRKKARKAATKAGLDFYTVDGVTRSTGLVGGEGGRMDAPKRGRIVSRGDMTDTVVPKAKTRLVDGKRIDISTGEPYSDKAIPTVFSDTTIRDEVIPDLVSRSRKLIGQNPPLTKNQTQEQTGVTFEEGTPQAPSDSSVAGEQNPYDSYYQGLLKSLGQPSQEEASADSKYQGILDKMEKSIDTRAQREIGSLKSIYDVREEQMKGSIASEGAGLRTALAGAGSRYAPGSAGGLMSFQEQQGILSLAQLDAEEQQAIARVEDAREEGNFQLLERELERAEAKRKEKKSQREKLFYMAMERNEEIAKQKIQAKKDNSIADLISKGITDPTKILSALNEGGGDFTAKEIGDTVENLIKNKSYPGGIIGEYEFYADQEEKLGKTPVSFNEYQNMDANRKVSIARAGIAGANFDPKQQAVFNRIVDKYGASEAIKALDRANQLENIVSEVENDPENAANQLSLIYAFIKGLDTDSAVREGEIDLVRSLNSYTDKFKLSFERIAQGKPVTGKVAKQIAEGAKVLINSIKDTARKKKMSFDAQAKQNGTQVYDAWKGYSDSIESIYAEEDSGQTQFTDLDNQSFLDIPLVGVGAGDETFWDLL